MSRCFPFPPPGYMRNGSRSDALIESIKLQRETEQAKKDRKKEKKERKREKKEKKKAEKERKHREATTSRDAAAQKSKLIDEIKEPRADGKLQKGEPRADGKLQKGEDCENEQLERSDITEELDQPFTSRDPCSSDSSQSSKRKRGDHGTAIRIRLPLRKHKEPEESKPGNQLGSSSVSVRIADSFTQGAGGSDRQLQCVPNVETKQFPRKSDSKHCKAGQNLVPVDTPPLTSEIIDDESRRMAALYNSLLQIPPLTYDGSDSLDQDWLFRSELTEAKPVSKKLKTDSDGLQCSKSLWPRAQYLPEVEIYALPYAVPF